MAAPPIRRVGEVDLSGFIEQSLLAAKDEYVAALVSQAGLSDDGTTRIFKRLAIEVRPDSGSLLAPAYALFIETGRRAGAPRPPITALAEWVVRKGIAEPARATGTAFAIANAIARRGIRPKPALRATFEQLAFQRIDDIFTIKANEVFDGLMAGLPPTS